jgi:molybdopterin molybdotransferase
LFLVPLIRRLLGQPDAELPTQVALLGRDLPANDERADYLRSSLTQTPQGLVATPFDIQDSSMLALLAKADCLVIREPFAPPAASGSPCRIVKLDR